MKYINIPQAKYSNKQQSIADPKAVHHDKLKHFIEDSHATHDSNTKNFVLRARTFQVRFRAPHKMSIRHKMSHAAQACGLRAHLVNRQGPCELQWDLKPTSDLDTSL